MLVLNITDLGLKLTHAGMSMGSFLVLCAVLRHQDNCTTLLKRKNNVCYCEVCNHWLFNTWRSYDFTQEYRHWHRVVHSFRHSPKEKKKTHQSINIIETIQPRIMREALKSMEVCGTKRSTDYIWHKCCHASCLIMALLFEYHNCNTLIFAFKQKCE